MHRVRNGFNFSACCSYHDDDALDVADLVSLVPGEASVSDGIKVGRSIGACDRLNQ